MTPYRQSYGEDGEEPFDDEGPLYLPIRVLTDWYSYDDYLEDNPVSEPSYYLHFNPRTRVWSCTCPVFKAVDKCVHVNRFRKEETVKVNRRYL